MMFKVILKINFYVGLFIYLHVLLFGNTVCITVHFVLTDSTAVNSQFEFFSYSVNSAVNITPKYPYHKKYKILFYGGFMLGWV